MKKKNPTREKTEKYIKSKGGRPKIKANLKKLQKEIIMEQVIYWMNLQATAEEIAGSFRVSVDTLDLRLKETYGMGFTELKKSLGDGADAKLTLRKYQFKQAEKSTTMAIWLGKQWLGQKDEIHQKTIIEDHPVRIFIPDNEREKKEDLKES